MPRLSFEETLDRLKRLIQAGYPVIYLVSHEEMRVFDCLARIVNCLRSTDPHKRLVRWNGAMGLQHVPLPQLPAVGFKSWLDTPGIPASWSPVLINGGEAPEGAFMQIENSQSTRMPELFDSVIVFFDLHPYLSQDANGLAGPMVRPLRNTADRLRRYYDNSRRARPHNYQTIVIVAPSDHGRSAELSRDVITLDFPLPETEELRRVLNQMVDDEVRESGSGLRFPDPIPPDDLKQVGGQGPVDYRSRLLELIASAGRGLTLHSYRQGLNMIRVENNLLRPKHIDYMLQLKADTINNRALEYTPHVKIELGGLNLIQKWINVRRAAATSREIRERYRLPAPKGVMLCGASGGGKSQLAKLMAKEFNLALLRLDMGSLFGSFIGESEQRAREALQLAEVLAPVVLWIDEIDKAFAGAGSGSGDSGVSARVFGYILTWLAEKKEDVFVVVTANDHQKIVVPFPEFGRKGRFDEIFWIGLPDEPARREIFKIYLNRHLQDEYLQVSDHEVTEIEQEFNVMNNGGDPASRLIATLASNAVSFRMTGAEIEYAIHEALYRAYDEDQQSPGASKFRPMLLAKVVEASKTRSLYNGQAMIFFNEAQADAASRNWPIIGSVVTDAQKPGN